MKAAWILPVLLVAALTPTSTRAQAAARGGEAGSAAASGLSTALDLVVPPEQIPAFEPGRATTAPAAAKTLSGPPAARSAPDGDAVAVLSMINREQVGDDLLRRGLRLQPRIRLGGVASGLRGIWDRPEVAPPYALRTGKSWDPREGWRDQIALGWDRMTSPEVQAQWARRGAVYYHDLPERHGEHQDVLHRYIYFFFLGEGRFWSGMGPHVVWVEVRERLDPTEPELESWRARARQDLKRKLGNVEALIAAGTELSAPAREARVELQRLLAGDVTPPAWMGIEEVVISDPVPWEGGLFRVRRYSRDQLEYYGDRPDLWVTEGNHRFLAGPSELAFGEECDGPWYFEPREGQLPLVDLRLFQHPENPLAARARGEDVAESPALLDTPVMLFGFREAARRYPELFEGDPFGASPPR